MALSGFRDSLAGAAKEAVCQALGASQQVGGAVVYAWQQVTGVNASPPDFAGVAKGLLCGTPSPPFGDSTATPYGGANCVCDRYEIQYGLNLKFGRPALTGRIRLYGPVAAITYRTNSAGKTGINFICRGPDGAGCQPGFVEVPAGAGSSAGDVESYSIYSVRNLTNAGASCGVPPTPTPTPLPDIGINLPDVSITFAPSVEVQTPAINANVNVLIFQPFVNLKAEIVVPLNLNVDLSVGSVNFNVGAEVNLNTGDVNFNFGGGSSNPATGGGGSGYRPPSDCDDVDEPVRPAPPKPPSVPGKPDDPDIEEKTILSGVIVTVGSVTLTNRASVINQGENPDIYAPSLGHVNFFLEIGDSKIEAWTADIPVKNRRQYIPCPYEEGAKSVAGTPQPGVIWELTPIYKKVRTQLPKESNNGA